MKTIFPIRPKKLLVPGAALIAFAFIALLLYRPHPQIMSLDPRLQILSARVLHDKNDAFYLGNQLEGRVRDFLRGRIGLKGVNPPIDLSPNLFYGQNRQRGLTVAVLFKWDGTQADLSCLTAELVDNSGGTIAENPYWLLGAVSPNKPGLLAWPLKPGWPVLDRYSIRLRMHGSMEIWPMRQHQTPFSPPSWTSSSRI